ncbi:unnamed protein product, partial [Polarella glacialis]
VELVVSPPVMILDEPTTGLDASSALALGHILAGLAEEGRILLCSLHQPRAELLALFHERLDLGVSQERDELNIEVCTERSHGDLESLRLPTPAVLGRADGPRS